MITKQIAMRLTHGDRLYFLHSKDKVAECRVSGQCKVWKTRMDHWRLPVKYGLYENAYIGTVQGCEDPDRFYVSRAEVEDMLPPAIKGRIGTKAQRAGLNDLMKDSGESPFESCTIAGGILKRVDE